MTGASARPLAWRVSWYTLYARTLNRGLHASATKTKVLGDDGALHHAEARATVLEVSSVQTGCMEVLPPREHVYSSVRQREPPSECPKGTPALLAPTSSQAMYHSAVKLGGNRNNLLASKGAGELCSVSLERSVSMGSWLTVDGPLVVIQAKAHGCLSVIPQAQHLRPEVLALA